MNDQHQQPHRVKYAINLIFFYQTNAAFPQSFFFFNARFSASLLELEVLPYRDIHNNFDNNNEILILC